MDDGTRFMRDHKMTIFIKNNFVLSSEGQKIVKNRQSPEDIWMKYEEHQIKELEW